MRKTKKLLPPVHPGEVLREDFMAPLKFSINRLALDLHDPSPALRKFIHERRAITPDTARRWGATSTPALASG